MSARDRFPVSSVRREPPPKTARRLEREENYPEQADALARLLDTAVRVPGTNFRVGLDPIIGLLPGIGDLLTGALSGYVVWLAMRAGVPPSVIVRMIGNIGIDSLIGAIPVLGDFFDFGWKANSRNVGLLQQYFAEPTQTKRASRGFVAGAIAAIVLIVVGGITLAVLTFRAVWALVE